MPILREKLMFYRLEKKSLVRADCLIASSFVAIFHNLLYCFFNLIIQQELIKKILQKEKIMNVILVIFDSLRKDCLDFLGQPPWGKVHTPNLARFAEESIVLTRCYPESLPTLQVRRSIYTGKRVYPFFGEKPYKGSFIGAPGWGPIKEDRSTISEILKLEGYTTAIISDIQHQFKPSMNFHRGFDEWNWIRGYESDKYRSGPKPTKEEINYWIPQKLKESINDEELMVRIINNIKTFLMNMQYIKEEKDYSVTKVMREAARWLEQNQDAENSFLIVESWSPHEPWFVPTNYREMYTNGKSLPQQVMTFYCDLPDMPEEIMLSTRANYSGLVTMCDKWFGYLYKTIKNLGMLDNTLIVVTTDHGHSIGDKNYFGKRGYPSSPEVYDVPIIIRHPNSSFGRGVKNNMLVQHTDITATILDMLKIEPKGIDYDSWNTFSRSDCYKDILNPVEMDGRSFLPDILDNKSKFRDHVTVGWGPAVTVITDEWWLNCRINGKGPFLYKLNTDEPFVKNLADAYPDVVKKLFLKAIEDAGGSFPEYLIEMADNEVDTPGCSPLVALDR